MTAVSIQPDPDDAPDGVLHMTVGEYINSSADGRPEPTYTWFCEDGQVISGIHVCSVTVNSAMHYTLGL